MKKAAKKKSRFAGVKAASTDIPQLGPGRYRITITSRGVSRDSGAAYFKLFGRIDEIIDDRRDADDPGEGDQVLAMLQCVDGKSSRPGYSRIKALSIALAKCSTEAEYDEMDPEGLFCEHVLSDGSDGLDENGDEYPDIEGMAVEVTIRRGRETKSGDDYFREHSWQSVADGEEAA